MKAIDFEYDSLSLSDFGMMLCKFDSSGIETIGMPGITFNTVSVRHGIKHELTSIEYADCLTFTLQICNNPCNGNSMEISLETARDIARWLNRKSFNKFKLIDDEWYGIYVEASFNISRIEIGGKLVGFELQATTNRPYFISEPVIATLELDSNEVVSIYNKSDEFGHIYPNMKITVKEAGDFEIYNAFEDRSMVVKNCEANEVITIDYPIISSSLASHKIANDFNWQFFRLASSFRNRLNEVKVSLPCTIILEYNPIVKVGI